MDHREIDDLWGSFWDGPGGGGIVPRYIRVRQGRAPGERFSIGKSTRAGGFPSPIIYTEQLNRETRRNRLCKRPLAKSPFRVLDAPSVINDYYLNLLDWTSKNVVALGLSNHLYLWSPVDHLVKCLESVPEDNYVSGISSSKEGILAVGTSEGKIGIYDTEKGLIMSLPQRNCRVSSISWGAGLVSAGAKDGSIFNYDIRSGEHVSSFLSHTGEVCGLKWDQDGVYLASGGNDNSVHAWRIGCTRPKASLNEHTAAVRAVDWCPWKKGVLATGGGSKDRCIKTWDIEKAVCVNSIDTGSQVCSILFSTKYKELISTHGYSNNSVCLWKFCTMRKVGEMNEHTDRVLYSALSPEGDVLATCAADENLNFWTLFEAPANGNTIAEEICLR